MGAHLFQQLHLTSQRRQLRTFRCWPLLGPTRLEARGSRGAQGDGEQGTQQWPPGNVRRCGRHSTRTAYGQGCSPTLEQAHLHFYKSCLFFITVFSMTGLKKRSEWWGLVPSTVDYAVLFNGLPALAIFNMNSCSFCTAWLAHDLVQALEV